MAKSKAKVKGGAKAQDAIALLKADHRQVEEWFEQFEKASDDDRKKTLATKICNALKVHTHDRRGNLLSGLPRSDGRQGPAP